MTAPPPVRGAQEDVFKSFVSSDASDLAASKGPWCYVHRDPDTGVYTCKPGSEDCPSAFACATGHKGKDGKPIQCSCCCH